MHSTVAILQFQTFTFTFMHLADAFIQSDLHYIQVTVSTFYQLLLSLGIEPMILALLAPCSTSWATGKLKVCVFLIQLKGHNMKYHSSNGHMTSRDTILQV